MPHPAIRRRVQPLRRNDREGRAQAFGDVRCRFDLGRAEIEQAKQHMLVAAMSQYIRQVVERYGTDHEQLDLNPDSDLEGAIENFAYYSDEPSADAGALPVWFLSKMTREHVTVALSGEGADDAAGLVG